MIILDPVVDVLSSSWYTKGSTLVVLTQDTPVPMRKNSWTNWITIFLFQFDTVLHIVEASLQRASSIIDGHWWKETRKHQTKVSNLKWVYRLKNLLMFSAVLYITIWRDLFFDSGKTFVPIYMAIFQTWLWQENAIFCRLKIDIEHSCFN